MDAKASNYPLTEKIRSTKARNVRDFLEWLEGQNLHLARSVGEEYHPLPSNPTHLIARFMGIDPAELEEEKRRMTQALARV